MPIGEPTMPTAGEPKLTNEERTRIAELEKSRALSDAELLKSGAEYVVGEKGRKRLEITDIQHKQAEGEMRVEIATRTRESRRLIDTLLLPKELQNLLDQLGYKEGNISMRSVPSRVEGFIIPPASGGYGACCFVGDERGKPIRDFYASKENLSMFLLSDCNSNVWVINKRGELLGGIEDQDYSVSEDVWNFRGWLSGYEERVKKDD